MDSAEDRSRREQLVAAVSAGRPLVLGDGGLPDWEPGDGPPPGDRLVAADVLRSVLVDRDVATRADPRGLGLTGAVVVGHLDLAHATVPYPFELTRCRLTHGLGLRRARIGGRLGLVASQLGADEEQVSVSGNGLHIEGDLVLASDPQGTRCHSEGAVRLQDAHVTGELELRGVHLGADQDGVSLGADGIRVDGGAFLDPDPAGPPFATSGAVRLLNARITSQLSMWGARLGADAGGVSLHADGLQVDGALWLATDESGARFTAQGAVRLGNSHVARAVELSGALIGADRERVSLHADGLQVDAMLLGVDDRGERFTADGAVTLLGAHVGRQLVLRGARLGATPLGADGGPVSLHAEGLRVDGAMMLDAAETAAGPVPFLGDGVVNLAWARLARLDLPWTPAGMPELGEVTGWQLGDVHGLVRRDREAAAQWLAGQPAAQPWHELANVYERNGEPADARWMRYRCAVQSTRQAPLLAKLARTAYRVTTGHGFYPMLTLVWLAAVFLGAWALTERWGPDFTTPTTATIRADLVARGEPAASGGPAVPSPPPGRALAQWCSPAWDTPCLSPAEFALATAVPAAATAQDWTPPGGVAPTAVFAGLRLAAWTLTALLLAGLTGLLRRQT